MRSGAIRNVESARVSIIGQLKKIDSNETLVGQEKNEPNPMTVPTNTSHAVMSSKIAEEEEEEGQGETASTKMTSPRQKSESESDDPFKKPQAVRYILVWNHEKWKKLTF